jgi:hypothetical protein
MRVVLLVILGYIAWRLLHQAVRRKIARLRGEPIEPPRRGLRPIDLVAIALLVLYSVYVAWHIWKQTG